MCILLQHELIKATNLKLDFRPVITKYQRNLRYESQSISVTNQHPILLIKMNSPTLITLIKEQWELQILSLLFFESCLPIK